MNNIRSRRRVSSLIVKYANDVTTQCTATIPVGTTGISLDQQFRLTEISFVPDQ
jgi:hypothetical protein